MSKKKVKNRKQKSGVRSQKKSAGKKPDSKDYCPTQKEAAAYVGVDVYTIRRWTNKDGKLPHYTNKGYKYSDLDERKANKGRTTDQENKEKTAEEVIKLKLQNQLLQRQLDDQDLQVEKKVEAVIVDRIVILKNTLLGLGVKVAARLPPKQKNKVKDLIDSEVKEAINSFAGGG